MSNTVKISRNIPENIIRRERLFSLFNQNADKSLILLCYPAGSGKTTLIRDFLSASKLNYGWVNASSDIAGCYDFLNSSIQSFSKLSPGFGNNTIQVIESLKQSEYSTNLKDVIATAVGTFINDFCSAFNDDVFLVLDDFHSIGNEAGWMKLTLDFLFANIPSNLHIIISSRQIPEFNLSYLNAKRKMFQPERDTLNFTYDETKELLEKIYFVEYSEEEIFSLQESLEGWVTGIHLAVQASEDQGMTQRVPAASSQRSWDSLRIFGFFAKEIFNKLDTQTKNFLLETALLESFDDRMCDEILNTDGSKKIISQLLRKNIFIEPLGDSYRYHALFKDFLLSKLYSIKSENKIKSSVEKICDYFLKSNDTVSAINYFLIGKQFSRAVDMIIEIGMNLLEENSYEILAKWLDLIPENVISENPYLLYFKARLSKYFISDLLSSIELYSKAIKLCGKLKDAGSASLQIDCYVAKAGAFSSLGKVGESLSTLKHLQKMQLATAYKIKMLYTLAFAYYRNTEYMQSIQLLNELFEIAKNENVKYFPEMALNLMGLNYYGMGEFPKSELYFERVIDAASNIFLKFRASTYLEILYSNAGKYKKAKELSKTTKSLGQFPGTFLELDSFMGELNLNFDTGDYESTIRTCEKIISLCDKLGYEDSKKHAYFFIAKSYYYLNNCNLSKINYEEGRKYLKENDPWRINFDIWTAILSKKNNSISFSELEKTLLGQYEFCETKNYGLDKCDAAFHLADMYLKNDMPESAVKYLKEALSIAQDKEYFSFLARELLDSRIPFDFALSENINKELVKSIFKNVLNKVDYDFMSEECRARISGQIDSLYDISMKSFGKLEFKVRGTPIADEKWIRKKSKLLLAYLLSNPVSKLNKDKIIDTFYPDVSSGSVDPVFHNTISDLRNILNKELSDRFAPEPVIYEHKELKLNPDCFYKIDAILFDEYYNKVLSPDSTPQQRTDASKKVIDLYQGDFLDGFSELWCIELRQNYLNKFSTLS